MWKLSVSVENIDDVTQAFCFNGAGHWGVIFLRFEFSQRHILQTCSRHF